MSSRLRSLISIESRDTIERWARSHVLAVPMPTGQTLCRVLGELTMLIDLQDLAVAPHLVMDGYWEIWNTICIARHVKQGWTSFDVGANFGYYTLVLAALTGSTVDAWEPDKDLCRFIDKSAKLNGLRDQVRIVNAAASDSSRVAMLVGADNDYGSCHVDEVRDGDPSLESHATAVRAGLKRKAIHCQRLDATGVSPDFLKIDAEGHEPAIWRGMQGLFESQKPPRAMLMEWTPSRYERPGEFLEEIRGRGYDVHAIDPQGNPQKVAHDISGVEGHLDLWLAR